MNYFQPISHFLHNKVILHIIVDDKQHISCSRKEFFKFCSILYIITLMEFKFQYSMNSEAILVMCNKKLLLRI